MKYPGMCRYTFVNCWIFLLLLSCNAEEEPVEIRPVIYRDSAVSIQVWAPPDPPAYHYPDGSQPRYDNILIRKIPDTTFLSMPARQRYFYLSNRFPYCFFMDFGS